MRDHDNAWRRHTVIPVPVTGTQGAAGAPGEAGSMPRRRHSAARTATVSQLLAETSPGMTKVGVA
jgi:hypothetical protein